MRLPEGVTITVTDCGRGQGLRHTNSTSNHKFLEGKNPFIYCCFAMLWTVQQSQLWTLKLP